ncbi:hypothetical protein V8C35DRAFT_232749 [Trichoderma chlorosporum]
MPFTKTYYLCPTSDFIHPPPTGPLCLGSIIRSTSTPQYSLNRAKVLAVADPAPPVVEINWKKTISTEQGFGLGVYAQFLLLPLGPEASAEHSNKEAYTFAFDTMTTLEFEPTQEYVQEAIKVPAVQEWLREPRQRFALAASLFLVTGIKLVKGARIHYSTSQKTKIAGNIGIDVPVAAAGSKGQWSSMKDDDTEFNRELEFVFAFRVKKLKFGRKLKVEDYNKGTLLAIDGEQEDSISVLVEDVDGSDIETAKVVFDATENGSVYCVSA